MDPKPGYVTTEFWSTVFIHVLTAVVTLASMFTHTPFDATGLQPLIPVAALVASGIAQSFYSRSRAHTKDSANRAAAQVLTTQAAVASGAPLQGETSQASFPSPVADSSGFQTSDL